MRGEGGLGGQQPPPHPRPLPALSGEDEDHLGRSGDAAHVLAVAHEPAQGRRQRPPVLPRHGDPVIVMRTPRPRAEAHVTEIGDGRGRIWPAAARRLAGLGDIRRISGDRAGGDRVGGWVEEVGVGGGQVAECVRVAGREREHAAGAGPGRFGRGGLVRFRQHEVDVGARHPERADPGHRRRRPVRPVLRAQGQLDGRAGVEQDRVRLLDVQRRRHGPVPHRQGRLEQPGQPGRELGVPDVGLDRAHQAARAVLAPFAHDRVERGQLGAVAGVGARPVRLDVVDVGRRDPRVAVGGTQHLLVPFEPGRDERGPGAAVVRGGAAQDHRVRPVAVGQCAGQRLEDHGHDAFAAYVPVAGHVAEPALARAGDHPGVAEREVQVGHELQVGAAHDGQPDLAGPQRPAGHVHREQGGRARGVQPHAGPAQV